MKSVRCIILVVLLLVGCANLVQPKEPIPSETMPGVSASSTQTSPTETMLISTPTTENIFGEQCFKVLNKIPDNESSNGIILLENQIAADGIRGLFTLNMKTKQIKNLGLIEPDDVFSNSFVSPNGTLLSVIKISNGNEATTKLEGVVIIATADGTIKSRISTIDNPKSGAVWLDNQRVAINLGQYLDENDTETRKILVLNPFTNERKILIPDFPEMFDGFEFSFPDWDEPWNKSLSIYNQSLTHVVYLSQGGYTYILWDINQNKEILRLRHLNNANREQPRWAPDGTKFLISAYMGDMNNWPAPADGLYMIDIKGNISKLMDTGRDIFIREHFWSPSGRYVALYLHVFNEQWSKKLLILDTQTLQIIEICVEFISEDSDDLPIWSPDETQILLLNKPDQAHSQVILVDLTKKNVYPLVENMKPTGWMKEP